MNVPRNRNLKPINL